MSAIASFAFTGAVLAVVVGVVCMLVFAIREREPFGIFLFSILTMLSIGGFTLLLQEALKSI